MSRHDSIDFGSRPPTRSAALPRRGELVFASISKKWPSSPIEFTPAMVQGRIDSDPPRPSTLLDALKPGRNRLTFTLSLSDPAFSQAIEVQTHPLNGSNLIKPDQTKKNFCPLAGATATVPACVPRPSVPRLRFLPRQRQRRFRTRDLRVSGDRCPSENGVALPAAVHDASRTSAAPGPILYHPSFSCGFAAPRRWRWNSRPGLAS
jgi:hypothetical protein